MDTTKFPQIVFSVPPKAGCREVIVRDDRGREMYKNVSQSEVAFTGKCRVVASKDSFFGGDRSKPYHGPVLTNPTWRRIKGEAQKAMRRTLDCHHVFLEGVYVKELDGDVTVLTLSMGS